MTEEEKLPVEQAEETTATPAEPIIVTQGVYLTSAVKPDQYPNEKKPEIVFIGRSNVGKSSLINSLTRVNNLARVSRQPGKTQTINYYNIGLKVAETGARQEFYLVDLPGYGYAKAGRTQRAIWAKFINQYLLKSQEIRFVCQLIDVRHEPMRSDVDMFQWLVSHGIPVLVVATKCDKVGTNARRQNIAAIKRSLGIPELDVLPYSSLKNEGRSELLDAIASSMVE